MTVVLQVQAILRLPELLPSSGEWWRSLDQQLKTHFSPKRSRHLATRIGVYHRNLRHWNLAQHCISTIVGREDLCFCLYCICCRNLSTSQFKTTDCAYRSNLVGFPSTWLWKSWKCILILSSRRFQFACVPYMFGQWVWQPGKRAGSPTLHFIHLFHLNEGWQTFFESFSQSNIFIWCQLDFSNGSKLHKI